MLRMLVADPKRPRIPPPPPPWFSHSLRLKIRDPRAIHTACGFCTASFSFTPRWSPVRVLFGPQLLARPEAPLVADYPEFGFEAVVKGEPMCAGWFRFAPKASSTFPELYSRIRGAGWPGLGLRHVPAVHRPADGDGSRHRHTCSRPGPVRWRRPSRGFIGAGLLVVVDPTAKTGRVELDPAWRGLRPGFWGAFAAPFGLDPDLTVWETVNEPVFSGQDEMEMLNERLPGRDASLPAPAIP